MLALPLLAGTLAAMGAAALCRPLRALAIVLLVLQLVPGGLPVPGLPGALTVHRLVLLAAAAGLLWRCGTDRLDWQVFRVPLIGVRLLLLVGGFAVLGVGLAESTTDVSSAARAWEAFAAQALCLLVVLALVRADGRPQAAVLCLVVVVALAAVVAVVEHGTGHSYARWWFRAFPDLLTEDRASALVRRGGQVRVRAAADFTLAFAWTTAACVPVALAAASLHRGTRRVLLLAAVPLMLLAVLWTYSRSVVLPLAVAVLFVLLRLPHRATRRSASALVAVIAAFVLSSPAVLHNFTVAVDEGSIQVRGERLPGILAAAAAHPFKGIGLSGLASFGFPSTDSSYLLAYAEVGAVGLALLVGVLVTAVAAAGQGARSDEPARLVLGLALGAGVVLLLLGAASFDAVTTYSVAELLWVLVAIGVAVGEAGPSPAPLLHLAGRTRLAAVGVLLAAGFVLRLAAPVHVAQTWQFQTLQPYNATAYAPTFTGTQLRVTACELLDAQLPDVRQTCQALGATPGGGLLRLQAESVPRLRDAAQQALVTFREVPTLEHVLLEPTGPATTGRPTVLRTAPVWLPLLGLVLLLPAMRRRVTGP